MASKSGTGPRNTEWSRRSPVLSRRGGKSPSSETGGTAGRLGARRATPTVSTRTIRTPFGKSGRGGPIFVMSRLDTRPSRRSLELWVDGWVGPQHPSWLSHPRVEGGIARSSIPPFLRFDRAASRHGRPHAPGLGRDGRRVLRARRRGGPPNRGRRDTVGVGRSRRGNGMEIFKNFPSSRARSGRFLRLVI